MTISDFGYFAASFGLLAALGTAVALGMLAARPTSPSRRLRWLARLDVACMCLAAIALPILALRANSRAQAELADVRGEFMLLARRAPSAGRDAAASALVAARDGIVRRGGYGSIGLEWQIGRDGFRLDGFYFSRGAFACCVAAWLSLLVGLLQTTSARHPRRRLATSPA